MGKAVPSEEGEAILADRLSGDPVPAVLSAQGLHEPRSTLRSAVHADQVALWEWDLTTNQVYFSPEYRHQLGAGEAELTIGLSEWETRLHPEDREPVTQGLRLYLANPGPSCYEAVYRLRCKDTTYRWMLMRAEVIRNPQNQPCRILGYQLEISEQRKAEEGQARLAAIVESSEDAIISKSLDGIVTSWNEGARRLFGYSAEEMLGQPVSRIIPFERSEEEAEILARLRRGERVAPTSNHSISTHPMHPCPCAHCLAAGQAAKLPQSLPGSASVLGFAISSACSPMHLAVSSSSFS